MPGEKKAAEPPPNMKSVVVPKICPERAPIFIQYLTFTPQRRRN